MAKQFLTSCFLSPSPSSSLSPAPTRIRPRKRLHPIGLLPTNARGYSLNQTTGRFVLFLDDKCRINLPPDNYLATYSKKITGKIVENSVKAFFKWWGIRSSGDNLVFEVGMVTAKYPSKNFDESPECEGKRSSS